MQLSSLAITPYIGATASRVRLGALKEQEMSGIAMQFDEQKYTTTYGKLGVKANHNLADTLNLFGDIHYQKQLSDNRKAASARLNTIANISFDTPMVKTSSFLSAVSRKKCCGRSASTISRPICWSWN